MTKTPFPSDQQDKFMLRLPNGMRDEIKSMADANRRSMNAEIVSALEAHVRLQGIRRPSMFDDDVDASVEDAELSRASAEADAIAQGLRAARRLMLRLETAAQIAEKARGK